MYFRAFDIAFQCPLCVYHRRPAPRPESESSRAAARVNRLAGALRGFGRESAASLLRCAALLPGSAAALRARRARASRSRAARVAVSARRGASGEEGVRSFLGCADESSRAASLFLLFPCDATAVARRREYRPRSAPTGAALPCPVSLSPTLTTAPPCGGKGKSTTREPTTSRRTPQSTPRRSAAHRARAGASRHLGLHDPRREAAKLPQGERPLSVDEERAADDRKGEVAHLYTHSAHSIVRSRRKEREKREKGRGAHDELEIVVVLLPQHFGTRLPRVQHVLHAPDGPSSCSSPCSSSSSWWRLPPREAGRPLGRRVARDELAAAAAAREGGASSAFCVEGVAEFLLCGREGRCVGGAVVGGRRRRGRGRVVRVGEAGDAAQRAAVAVELAHGRVELLEGGGGAGIRG